MSSSRALEVGGWMGWWGLVAGFVFFLVLGGLMHTHDIYIYTHYTHTHIYIYIHIYIHYTHDIYTP